ncbi:MAG TPA: T9SS type A sorting domain-containing protein, partial [Ignavibacteria bacterium]|nr:T9SS type A sorting domain-containing protein [Ignavibacteria bacterium]
TSLKIYDISGREIAVLVNRELAPGKYSANFEAKNLPSGIYIYKLQYGEFTASRKMILVK